MEIQRRLKATSVGVKNDENQSTQILKAKTTAVSKLPVRDVRRPILGEINVNKQKTAIRILSRINTLNKTSVAVKTDKPVCVTRNVTKPPNKLKSKADDNEKSTLLASTNDKVNKLKQNASTSTVTAKVVQQLEIKGLSTKIADIDLNVSGDVPDVDAADMHNPFLLAEYVNDIFDYLMQMERKHRISPNYLDKRDITPNMRAVLVDWLIEVQQEFHLLQETLHLSVAIIDMYLEKDREMSRDRLQLLGITAMMLACKYEEMYVPQLSEFAHITDNAVCEQEIMSMECVILKTINFDLSKPISLSFLRRFSKIGALQLLQTYNMF